MQNQRQFGCSVSVFMVSKRLTNHFSNTRPSVLVSGSVFDSESSMNDPPGCLFSCAAGLTNMSPMHVLQQTSRVERPRSKCASTASIQSTSAKGVHVAPHSH